MTSKVSIVVQRPPLFGFNTIVLVCDKTKVYREDLEGHFQWLNCTTIPVFSLVHSCLTLNICRSADLPTRQRYVRLVESVRDGGGTVRVFSSLHVSGEREEFLLAALKKNTNLFFSDFRAGSVIRRGSYPEISSTRVR